MLRYLAFLCLVGISLAVVDVGNPGFGGAPPGLTEAAPQRGDVCLCNPETYPIWYGNAKNQNQIGSITVLADECDGNIDISFDLSNATIGEFHIWNGASDDNIPHQLGRYPINSDRDFDFDNEGDFYLSDYTDLIEAEWYYDDDLEKTCTYLVVHMAENHVNVEVDYDPSVNHVEDCAEWDTEGLGGDNGYWRVRNCEGFEYCQDNPFCFGYCIDRDDTLSTNTRCMDMSQISGLAYDIIADGELVDIPENFRKVNYLINNYLPTSDSNPQIFTSSGLRSVTKNDMQNAIWSLIDITTKNIPLNDVSRALIAEAHAVGCDWEPSSCEDFIALILSPRSGGVTCDTPYERGNRQEIFVYVPLSEIDVTCSVTGTSGETAFAHPIPGNEEHCTDNEDNDKCFIRNKNPVQRYIRYCCE